MKARLFIVLWLAGLPGIAAVTLLTLPSLIGSRPLPVPMWVVQVSSTAQSAALVALAVWSGVALAARTGLRAPMIDAAIAGELAERALRRQCLPGIVGGLLGGVLLVFLARYAPAALREVREIELPLVARLLYGGITEELIVRWGLMSALLWLAVRITHGEGPPATWAAWLAIVSSALLFGAGHLPAAHAMLGNLTAPVVGYLIAANASFGLIAGWLFWRFGLEAAIMAHMTAHLVMAAAA